MPKNLTIRNSTAQFLIYKSDNQDVKVDVLLHDENIWLTHSHLDHIADIANILDNYFNLRKKSGDTGRKGNPSFHPPRV